MACDMRSASAMNTYQTEAAIRLAAIDKIVSRYMRRHIGMDVGIGLAGLIPLPGVGTSALVASLALQTPLVYQPMVKKISTLYHRAKDKNVSHLVNTASAADAGLQLATEFGYAFMREHARELLHDQSFALVAGWIPFVGGIAAASVDAIIARKMTIIVAAMTVIYFENRSAWLTSKQHTRSVITTALKTGAYVSFIDFVSSLIQEYVVDIVRDAPASSDSGAEADSALAGLSAGNLVGKIDPHVLDALERLNKGVHIDSLDGFKEAFTTNAGVFMDAGHLGRIKGYVAEEVSAHVLHENLPPNIAAKTVDISHAGQDWQIKSGSTAYERALEHLQAHPEVSVISDDDTVSKLHAAGYPDSMPIHDLDNDHLIEITHDTSISIDELIYAYPDLPIISIILVGLQEVAALRRGDVTIHRAIANVAMQVGSREAGIFFFTLAAVTLAAAVHILPVAGTFVAGAAVTGGLTGKEIGARMREMRMPASLARALIRALQSLNRGKLAELRATV